MGEMAHSIEFWDGQLFELHTHNREVYYTQLIKNGPDLLIQRPTNKKNIPMSIIDYLPVTVYFQDDQQGLCTFESKVYLHKNNQITINRPSADAIKKAQRRRFFRVNANVETYLIMPQENKARETEELAVLTHDISGGGLSFLYPGRTFREGDILKGSLNLKTDSGHQKVAFDGRIVNMIKQENNFFKTSIEFINMNESIRSEIIKFCIQKQVEIRKKLTGNRY